MKYTKRWKEYEIKRILETNNDQLVKALCKLMEYQTSYEKYHRTSSTHNRVGFNKPDSKRMTTYYFRSKNRQLTEKEIYWLRKHIMKYTRQLTRILNGDI